jgi:cytochrome c-type biogenesis protein CcmE
MKLRFPLSTLCLLVAVVALTFALFLLTARQNAQLKAITAQLYAQLAEQENRHNSQRAEQALEFHRQLRQLTDKHNAQLAAKDAATASAKP